MEKLYGKLHYIEIENFKTFGGKLRVDLDHPTVLIGPNNSGKTSVVQALALWNRGIRDWYKKKGQPQKKKLERISVGINRKDILEIPVSETRLLWHETRVRKGSTPIELKIGVGMEYEHQVHHCGLVFTYRDNEVLYCRPCEDTIKNEKILEAAAGMQLSLLYPMSGLEVEEPLVKEGRINVLMGQGQTAQVLRNLCYMVTENDQAHNKSTESSDWKKITDLIEKLFSVTLKRPQFNAQLGTLSLKYSQGKSLNDLDISLAGRGLQQMLLILAYLYSHKNNIILIDEPDAHLEILRQKQVFEILKEVAGENGSQVVIATHSEVILDDAVETNLTLLIDCRAVDLAEKKDMRHALRSFGIEHYYKARVHPRIIYLEGSTDLANLKALAKKLNHPAREILDGPLNYYYIRDNVPEDSLDKRLDLHGGAYREEFRGHFHTLKRFVPDFRGIAVFDSDGMDKKDNEYDSLAVVYWKSYELENYFITPEIILKYIDETYQQDASLFKSHAHGVMKGIIDRRLCEDLFSGDEEQVKEFWQAGKAFRRTLLKKFKMSTFAEKVFAEFGRSREHPVGVPKKGNFYQLIDLLDIEEIPVEVVEKLDLVVRYLKLEDRE